MPDPPPARRAVRFGAFEVDLRAAELRKNGLKVHLQEQPFQILAMLLERPGEMVTREELRRKLWPDDIVVAFDQGLSNAVNKLRAALGDSAESPRFIETLARRGYRFIAPVSGLDASATEDEGPLPAGPSSLHSRHLWPAGLVATAVMAGAVFLVRLREIELAPPRLVKLTSMLGQATQPTFSPDGGQIAFAWDGETRGNWDIYLKMIGSSEIRRLTTDPAPDLAPSWSPDGLQIAFVRSQPGTLPLSFKGRGTIHLLSPVSGSDRKLSDFPVHSRLSWSPDGRWLAVGRCGSAMETDPGAMGIYLIPVLGGEPRPMTSAKAPAFHHSPALSPVAHHLAYASCASDIHSCHVDLVELGTDYVPAGPPRRLTRRAGWIASLAWTRDGNSLIYGDATTGRLWRVWIVGDRPPERIELAGLRAVQPATAASLDRLAFVHGLNTVAIYRFEVGHPPEALLGSSLQDTSPHFSPNGRRIAFESQREAVAQPGVVSYEIWLAAADGSNPMQLTHGPGIWQGSPRWSPDGQRIAFDSQAEDGKLDIWTIDADGGSARRLTLDPGDKQMPSWSRDGRWIYFQSDRAGALEIWRIPATGGSEERVTHGGGNLAYESADGKTLFFTRARGDAPLLALPLAGGPERKVLECVPDSGFTVGPGAIYHLGCTADRRAVPLYLLDPATGQDRLLGKLEEASGGFTVSPDGKTILYTKWENRGSDLMMIENFR